MKNGHKISFLIALAIVTSGISPAYAENTEKPAKGVVCVKENDTKYMMVEPLELVSHPNSFMGKEIKIKGEFHKFSTLGLDYDRAMRSSKDYISVLIKRPDVAEQYTIPLSELKLIMKRDAAEEMLEMESGDKVEITGKVFSSALNDPWVDVYELTSLEPKEEEKDSTEKAEMKK